VRARKKKGKENCTPKPKTSPITSLTRNTARKEKKKKWDTLSSTGLKKGYNLSTEQGKIRRVEKERVRNRTRNGEARKCSRKVGKRG